MAGRGLRRIAALRGLGRIAGCMSGALQCKDVSFGNSERHEALRNAHSTKCLPAPTPHRPC
eukprot:9304940-Alexandrium_andersonii.AAC.1